MARELRVDGEIGRVASLKPRQAVPLLLQQRHRSNGTGDNRLGRNHTDAQQPVDGPTGPGVDQVTVSAPFYFHESLISARGRERSFQEPNRRNWRIRLQRMNDADRPGLVTRLRTDDTDVTRQD